MASSQSIEFHRLDQLEHNPNSLQRLLLVLGVASMIIILTLSGVGIYRVSTEAVLSDAEEDGVRIAKLMISQQYRYLFSAGDKNISLNNREVTLFDQQTKDFLHPFAIVKIKVFNLNREIIYSTDTNIIGMKVQNNARLDRALRGEIDSKLETRDQVFDLAEEQLLDVDVVETYLPVYNSAGEIAGSLELYLDVTRYRNKISHQVTSSILVLTAILLGVFALSFWVVRIGAKQLKTVIMQLQQMAVTDPLTGVFNRGAVIRRAEEELSLMERRKHKESPNHLGVIMMDIDHFKKINDTYGHQTGDKVLLEVSRRITASLREYDTFGRYGGEEFLVLIPNCGCDGALNSAERIRQSVSGTPLQIDSDTLHITASFGVTCCHDSAEGFDASLRRADDALYQAKHSGRNQTIRLEI